MRNFISTPLFWQFVLCALTFSHLGQSRNHDSSPSQYEANCPRSCSCNKTTIICDRGNFVSTDIFLPISDIFYPDLETLAIRGNRFSELEPTNLFGPNITHRRLTRVVLTDNDITVIHAQAFEAIKWVEELDLSFNNVSSIEGDLFKDMSRLTGLELKNFFDDQIDVRKRAHLLQEIFTESASDFSELKRLTLDENYLAFLPKDIFCKLPALEILSLRNNLLPSFTADSKCLLSIISLDLSQNQITLVPQDLTDLIDNAVHLSAVNFSNNPFTCNCYLADFVTWFQRSQRLATRDDVTCGEEAEPESLIGSELAGVKPGALKCPRSSKDYLHTVYIFVALSLIGLCLLMACLVYNNRSALLRIRKELPVNGKARYRVVSGYEPLDKEEEVKAEFV